MKRGAWIGCLLLLGLLILGCGAGQDTEESNTGGSVSGRILIDGQ